MLQSLFTCCLSHHLERAVSKAGVIVYWNETMQCQLVLLYVPIS